MSVAGTSFDLARLNRLLQDVEPSARFVTSRVLRRVIRGQLNLESGQRVHHSLCIELSKTELLQWVSASDIGVPPESLPDTILLLPLPTDEELKDQSLLLSRCWHTLFHAAIDRSVDRACPMGFEQDPRLFNATVLYEVRTVLESEQRIAVGADGHVVFREFAALFLELWYFAPHLVQFYFPCFLHPDTVAALLESQTHSAAHFVATRPLGAPQPSLVIHEERKKELEIAPATKILREPAEAQPRAAKAAVQGNDVRAAILYRQLGKVTDSEARLNRLVERLQKPLHLSGDDRLKWYAALRPLLEPASTGFWTAAGRLLYELQKACLDIERQVYAVDAIEWVASRGRKSIVRHLDKLRDLNVLRRLRAALYYAGRASISIQQRETIIELLDEAIEHCEQRIWQSNRPIITEVLDEVGLTPANQVEKIARAKLIDELLDTLCERGFLGMSDVRDAIARNRIKLDDLSGPGELIRGDVLLKANRALALRLDGVYRRGEIYLRGLQRLTSLAFGTAVGRLLVLWLVLPFGGSFVALEGVHHLLGAAEGAVNFVTGHNKTVRAVGMVAGGPAATIIDDPNLGESPITSIYTIVIFGVFLLTMLHSSTFRRRVASVLKTSFVDIPRSIHESEVVRWLFTNRAVRFFARYLMTSLLSALITLVVFRFFHIDWKITLIASGSVALVMGAFFRSPLGRGVEERMDEFFARFWRLVSVNFIIGALTLIVRVFRTIFEYIDRGIYAIDEWMRFREGESNFSLVFKLTIGTIWFFIAYIFRFAWNLLIEPQINPIKHFPVVTVSHKLLLPMVPGLAKSFEISLPTMTTIVSGIPGIFGFLVWECKENWKLYKANCSSVLGAVAVGSHGESVRGLLRPGFHSGAVPKLFAKLRRAGSAAKHKKLVKLEHNLEHIAEAAKHLAERGLIAYLAISQRWAGLPIYVHDVKLATNRIRLILMIHQRAGAVVISIEERYGWLIGSIEELGWIVDLSSKQKEAFADALAGVYKVCNVHVIREQVAAVLGIATERLDCGPKGLMVRRRTTTMSAIVGDQRKDFERDVHISYAGSATWSADRPIDGRSMSPISAAELMFDENPIEWAKWVERWEADEAGKAPSESLVGNYRLLPGS